MQQSRESELFCQALEIPSEERVSFVEQAAISDPQLVESVKKRLALLERLPAFLEKSYLPARRPETAKAEFGPGDTIGPYRVLRLIGRGGMGEVYLTEQDNPIQRRLALKVIKASPAHADALKRLEIERQTLALMNHPHIARVIDGGSLADGSPYFVMEYLEGLDIVRFIRQHRLSVDQRLAVFLDICGAIRHAHQKGVIHRDIKPSNIMMTHTDGKFVPKVIDFGLAKLTAEISGLKRHHSTQWRVLGTLPYVSPEQLGQSRDGVDTRTDIYALGVLLYEMLTGVTPFESDAEPGPLADLELARRIREEMPQRPSRIVASIRKSDPEIAAAWAELPGPLADDLDWIVLKTLEKSPDSRYGDIAGLQADISNAMANLPISAGPPHFRNRAAKIMRRNRAVIIGSLAGVSMLLIAIAGLSVGMIRARRAESLADASLLQANEAYRKLSQSQQATQKANHELVAALGTSEKALRDSNELSRFLVEVFDTIHRDQPLREVHLMDVIRKASEKFRISLELAREDHARLFFAMGNRLVFENEYGLAIEPFEMAFEIQSRSQGLMAMETIESAVRLARCYEMTGQFEEARARNEVVLASIEISPERSTDRMQSILRTTKLNQARIHEKLGAHSEALRLLDQLQTLMKPDDINLAIVSLKKAMILRKTGNDAEAIRQVERTLKYTNEYPESLRSITAGIEIRAAEMLLDTNPEKAVFISNRNLEFVCGPEMQDLRAKMAYLQSAIAILDRHGDSERAAALRNEMAAAQKAQPR